MKKWVKKFNILLVFILLLSFNNTIFASGGYSDYGSYGGNYDYSNYYGGNYDYSNYYGGNYDYSNYYGGNYDYSNYYGGNYDYSNYYSYYDYYGGDYDYSNYYSYYDYYGGDYDYSNYYSYYDYYGGDYDYSNYYSYYDDYYPYYNDQYYPQSCSGSSCGGSRIAGSSHTPTSSHSPAGRSHTPSGERDVIINNRNVNNNTNEVIVIRDDNRSQNLNVACNVSRTNISRGQRVVYTAVVSGGRSPYTYYWSGPFQSNDSLVDITYNLVGRYNASITVRDSNGQTGSANCPVVVVEDDDDFRVQCLISETNVDNDDQVRVEVDIDGGRSPYTIRWSGDTNEFNDFDRNARSQRVRVNTDEDRIRLEVSVTDRDGNRRTDTCSVIRVDDNNNDREVRVITNNPPSGQLAGLSSVFLSQVPYTGPEDIIKVTGFISLILIWSAIIGFIFLKNRQKKLISRKIASFKEMNRLNKFNN
jgi:hypothetical protein